MTELYCAAVVAIRNERPILERLLPRWLAEGLDVVVIDHESSDGGRELMEAHLGQGVLWIDDLPWRGHFSLEDQLLAKASIVERLHHPWVMHLDADEWPQSNKPGESLIQGLTRLEREGANAVNFEEFVILPTGVRPESEGYYMFAPAPRRLMRAWRRECRFSNLRRSGHRLEPQPGSPAIQVANENLVLRHYLVRSEDHAAQTYLGRRFAEAELAKGMHSNRVGLSRRELVLPKANLLQPMPANSSLGVQLDRSQPKKLHYWHWPDSTKAKPCRTLVCLYGCRADEELLEPFYNSQIGSFLLSRDDSLVLEVWAGGEGQASLERRRLTLPVLESYSGLPLKTWQMLVYCCTNLQFDQLVKIDLTCVRQNWTGPAYSGRKPIDLALLRAYLEQRLAAPLPQAALPQPHYDGFLHHACPSRENVMNWATKKGAEINLERVFGPDEQLPGFYSGKCYTLSAYLANYVAGQPEDLALNHQQNLHGSEDLMVGRLARQLSQYKSVAQN